ncbi:MAG: hypothetical protein M0R49_06080 [Limnochordia bacterium]|jgi:hypothetical protein|nr:hypothetical protein [Limnochordia bacterium]
MSQSPDKLQKWLQDNKDRVLTIQKEEDGHLDRITIRLRDVDMVRHQDTDDYLSDQALLLIGEGTVRTSGGRAPLPSGTFEISLTDHWSVSSNHRSLQLQTERGNYSIELNKLDP